MKQKLYFFLLLGQMLMNGSCQSASSVTTNNAFDLTDDKACRETIQKLYSIENYCPDNLIALQSLFTDEFNRQNQLSLERCNQVSSYEVLTLLSEDDPDFPDNPTNPKLPGIVEYSAKINIMSKSGNALGNNPSIVWLHMKIDDSGACKIDSIHGGG